METTNKEIRTIVFRLILRCTVILGGIWVLCRGLPQFFALFAPFVLALWVAYLFQPLATRLEHCMKWKRNFVVLWLLSFVVLTMLAFLWIVIPTVVGEIRYFASDWEPLLEEMMLGFGQMEEKLTGFLGRDLPWIWGDGLAQATEELKAWMSAWTGELLKQLGNWAMTLPNEILRGFVFVLATYFLACDYDKYALNLKKITPPCCSHLATELKRSVVTAFAGYLKAQFLLSSGVFVIMLGGFFWMNLHFSLLLAFGIALLDFIPMIGAGVVLLPWAGFSYLMGDPARCWQLLVIWFGTAFFRHLLEPKILGNETGLSPFVSLLSIYVGLEVAGIWGMIFAPVVVLVAMHFCGLGIFRGFFLDVQRIYQNISTLFHEESQETNQPEPE